MTTELDRQNHRAALVRQRDALNAFAFRGSGLTIEVPPREAAAARAESERLTKEIGKVPNLGRRWRRAAARRVA